MLYIIATPIGNLGDITARALETLRAVPVIAAEDTRSARRLLAAFDIPADQKQIFAYGEHNEAAVAPRFLEHLQAGRDVAIVSEGGTPLVSDPGYRLVQAALGAGIPIVPLPGACAVVTALSASGLPVHGFIFRGFLPKKPGARRRILESVKDREETFIFYESPQRVEKIFPELLEIFGPERQACLARELTKLHETFLRGSLAELAAMIEKNPPRGEITFLISGRTRFDEDAESD